MKRLTLLAVALGLTAPSPLIAQATPSVDLKEWPVERGGRSRDPYVGPDGKVKKAYGTVHLALGDSANEYGGTVECDVHLDGLVMSPTVAFDGRDVVAGGRHLYAGGLDG